MNGYLALAALGILAGCVQADLNAGAKGRTALAEKRAAA